MRGTYQLYQGDFAPFRRLIIIYNMSAALGTKMVKMVSIAKEPILSLN